MEKNELLRRKTALYEVIEQGTEKRYAESLDYDLGDILEYLEEEARHGSTRVCFQVTDLGELHILTGDEDPGQVDGSGFDPID